MQELTRKEIGILSEFKLMVYLHSIKWGEWSTDLVINYQQDFENRSTKREFAKALLKMGAKEIERNDEHVKYELEINKVKIISTIQF